MALSPSLIPARVASPLGDAAGVWAGLGAVSGVVAGGGVVGFCAPVVTVTLSGFVASVGLVSAAGACGAAAGGLAAAGGVAPQTSIGPNGVICFTAGWPSGQILAGGTACAGAAGFDCGALAWFAPFCAACGFARPGAAC